MAATSSAEPPQYSVVVPVYCGAATLPELQQRVSAVMASLGASFEMLFIDDGSSDDSWPVIRSLAADDPRVRGVQLMRNYGQANAVMCGLSRARGRFVFTMDDDLQNPPEEMPKLIEAMTDDLDVVIGAPIDKRHNAARNLASVIVNWLSGQMVHKGERIKLTSFRLIRSDVVGPLVDQNMPTPAPGAQLTTITKRVVNVPVEHHPRRAGSSGYTFAKMLNLAIAKFLGFSTAPLRMLSTIGLVGMLGSIATGAALLGMHLTGVINVPGYASTSLLLVAIAGINFLGFGILGEYLHQILISVRQTKPWLIRTELGADVDHDDDRSLP